MSGTQVFEISAAGMALERTRVEVAALNLANIHTAQKAGSAGFVPLQVVAQAANGESFAAMIANGGNGESTAASLAGALPAFRIEAANVQPRRVHEPGHPLADAQGFVTYPGVDTATEMMTLLGATRAYEANVAAMNMSRNLALKALDIGGNS